MLSYTDWLVNIDLWADNINMHRLAERRKSPDELCIATILLSCQNEIVVQLARADVDNG